MERRKEARGDDGGGASATSLSVKPGCFADFHMRCEIITYIFKQQLRP